MRSPFAYIRHRLDEVSDLATRLVEAVERILGAFHELIQTIHVFESLARAPRAQVDEAQIDYLNSRIDALTVAVNEGVNNVQRSERRVRAVVRSARKELAEHGYAHAGVEAENDQLREIDGEGSGDDEVQVVPDDLAGVVQTHSVIPGVSQAQLRTAFRRRR